MVADEASIPGALDPYEDYEIDDGDYNYVPERAKMARTVENEAMNSSTFTIHVGDHLATVIDSAMDELSLDQNFADLSVEESLDAMLDDVMWSKFSHDLEAHVAKGLTRGLLAVHFGTTFNELCRRASAYGDKNLKPHMNEQVRVET